jgi:hypothetical protein
MAAFEHALASVASAPKEDAPVLHLARAMAIADVDTDPAATARFFAPYLSRCSEEKVTCVPLTLTFGPSQMKLADARTHRTEIGNALCNAGQALQVESIVLGWRQIGTMSRLTLGSVAQHLLHKCPVSVSIVKEFADSHA